MLVIHTKDARKWELYNKNDYYKVNWCIFWDEETKRIYKRFTFTGEEIDLGEAKTYSKAKQKIKKLV